MAIYLDVLGMCRICLSEEHLIDVLMLGEPTAQLMSDINRYFNVQLTFHDDKSTKICRNCFRKIEVWRRDMHFATNTQTIINFLDSKVQKQSEDEKDRRI